MAMLKNIESVDLTTFGGRLYFDIYQKFGSVNGFCKQNSFHLREIQKYVANQTSPSLEKIYKLGAKGLDLDFLINGKKDDEYKIDNRVGMVKEPVVEYAELEGIIQVDFYKGVASAGHGAFAQERIKQVPFPKYVVKGIRKPAMVKASGDSMCPTIEDGDLLLFEQVHSAKNGNTIICTYGDDVYVKKYIQTPKHLCLRSLNNKFEDIEIESEKLIIHGVVKKIIKSL